MLVLRKEQALFKDNSGLKGIKFRWFTKNGLMQEAVFNTKDLIKVENDIHVSSRRSYLE